ncbi:hypothetical protein CDG76_13575 [Nostoc sp. 'Peltigera membranacea cyanobiont' 210A]|uniref:hypothetical protein n=1 Tax=Nostoc sp. 'Peltigera membranacea cyanobiont' 210A TaxID=2014529 RepID=UPI000B9582C9|nr:hypothetical protein [Nostoc sp. 'Peltigera membranacea cyanobiont' 210A]OYD94450.1 hypothetical protein CDG76_13575 [Nostoc sp. 'Peltigera membranacea cyanobiont' 210A]
MTSKNTSTRLLLALWDLGGTQQEVKKGQLTKRIVAKSQKVADYQGIFEELQKQGAIAISKKGYSLTSGKGVEVLGEGLRSGEFKFEGTIVGTWAANALVKWINQIDVAVTGADVPVNGKSRAIASYDEFKSVALEVYDKLNYEYNFNNLVPIYRIRRGIGDRVSRTEFNDWLLETQAEDILQLQGGSVEDSAPDKIEDSVATELDGLRCYATRLKS